MNSLEQTALLAGVLSSLIIAFIAACLYAYIDQRSQRRIWEQKMKKEWWLLPPD